MAKVFAGVALTGSAKAFDHSCIVHCIWTLLAKLHCCAWVVRVPTAENIADLPSRCVDHRNTSEHALCNVAREEYKMLLGMGAERTEAKLDASFLRPQAWESLSVFGVFG